MEKMPAAQARDDPGWVAQATIQLDRVYVHLVICTFPYDMLLGWQAQ
jgi:hypothetical protein